MAEAIWLALSPVGELHGGRGRPERVISDSLAACTFLRDTLHNVFGGLAQWGAEMLNAACGWNLGIKDWNDLTDRVAMYGKMLFPHRAVCAQSGRHATGSVFQRRDRY